MIKKIKRRATGLAMIIFLAGFALVEMARGDAVTLNWQSSASSAVTGYLVFYGQKSGNYTTITDNGANTSAAVQNLQPGLTYYFTVVAYDAYGDESAPCNEIQFTIPVPAPAAATGLALLTNLNGEFVTLRFPVNTGHWYEIQASTDLQNWTTICQTSVASQDMSLQFSDPQASQFKQRFYRLVTH